MIIYGQSTVIKNEYAKNVNITPDNTWLIFGCSQYINTIKRFIPDLLSKYPNTIGLNRFYEFFPDVKYICANDYYPIHFKQKLILNIEKNVNVIKENKPVYYSFKGNITSPVLTECGELYGRHSVALPAINYVLLQGAENVVLIGVDFSSGWSHFYENPQKVNIRKATSRNLRLNRMLHCLSELNKYINIYNLNPDARTNIPIIDIDALCI